MEKEKRLIDANAAVELLRRIGSRDYRREKGTIMDAMKMLSSPAYTPTVDAVEVVRCKDCKHWKYDSRKLCGRCDALMCYRPDYFWCMYGERRTDNG